MGAKKQFLKASEAKILIMLNQIPKYLKYAAYLSAKLNIDYVYIRRLLKGLVIKGWLKTHHFSNKVYYDINSRTPILTAKKVLSDGGQRRLKCK